ncbi:MAG: NAD(P)H-dependent oxidoreductase [Sphingomonadaceae bacterium]|nr:NAD(P)H-dependent oxidoreductase [Sphingomonadaceae bacterium]MCP5390870.1 NAD(P)H-dependent oxidoreductase [Sphingomonadaceae bacterium]MCP5394626.1 NAD(P)H-dependent oxidoreductase [Sphingomonadaceae bacterium]
MQILRIDSAVTGANAISRKLTQAMTDHFMATNPGATLVERDLEKDPLPHIDQVTTGAIRMPPEDHTPEMAAAYPAERAVLDEFLASDVVIIGAPMYNFTVPTQLKAWIDRLGVPRVTFAYSETGPKGLAGGRRVIIASSRGGVYETGGPADFQEALLLGFFRFIGLEAEIVRVQGIGFGPEALEKSMAEAMSQIAAL